LNASGRFAGSTISAGFAVAKKWGECGNGSCAPVGVR